MCWHPPPPQAPTVPRDAVHLQDVAVRRGHPVLLQGIPRLHKGNRTGIASTLFESNPVKRCCCKWTPKRSAWWLQAVRLDLGVLMHPAKGMARTAANRNSGSATGSAALLVADRQGTRDHTATSAPPPQQSPSAPCPPPPCPARARHLAPANIPMHSNRSTHSLSTHPQNDIN